jgi:hypothetical protein
MGPSLEDIIAHILMARLGSWGRELIIRLLVRAAGVIIHDNTSKASDVDRHLLILQGGANKVPIQDSYRHFEGDKVEVRERRLDRSRMS